MNIQYSRHCVIDDNLQLHVSSNIATETFDIISTTEWVKINNLPDLLQVFYGQSYRPRYLIALTIDGQLLMINHNHPSGLLIEVELSDPIKYIHDRIVCKSHSIILIDDKYQIYNCPIPHLLKKISEPDYVMIPQLLGSLSPSLPIIGNGYLFLAWFNDGTISLFNDGDVRTSPSPYQPVMIDGDRLIIDDHNDVYLIQYRYDRNDTFTGCEFIKLFHANESVIDVAFYPGQHISTIDDGGIRRQYCRINEIIRSNNVDENGQLRRFYHSEPIIDNERINRFINFYDMTLIELEDGEVTSPNLPKMEFKLLDLEEYYQPKIKSALG